MTDNNIVHEMITVQMTTKNSSFHIHSTRSKSSIPNPTLGPAGRVPVIYNSNAISRSICSLQGKTIQFYE